MPNSDWIFWLPRGRHAHISKRFVLPANASHLLWNLWSPSLAAVPKLAFAPPPTCIENISRRLWRLSTCILKLWGTRSWPKTQYLYKRFLKNIQNAVLPFLYACEFHTWAGRVLRFAKHPEMNLLVSQICSKPSSFFLSQMKQSSSILMGCDFPEVRLEDWRGMVLLLATVSK